MKQITQFLLFTLFAGTCFAQAQPASDYGQTIKKQAETMGQSLLKKDFNTFVQFAHPSILTMAGGKQKMIEGLTQGMKAMETQGGGILNVAVGEPSTILTTKDGLQCTLPQVIDLKVPNGKLVSKSTLIAVSTDKGSNWYFIDTSGKDLATMQKVIPSLSSELVIPPAEEPKFQSN
ncbi:hypothetical protein ACFQ4C_20795 [Larkinella insperata]|uniref:DUF4251 domain-containing protein n=1 Tax=Larkinella insperata TaxID=332158 RepID=A0ABW3QKT6_9BACT